MQFSHQILPLRSAYSCVLICNDGWGGSEGGGGVFWIKLKDPVAYLQIFGQSDFEITDPTLTKNAECSKNSTQSL